jgi:hypothetical protein
VRYRKVICALDTGNLEIAGNRVRSPRNGWTQYEVNTSNLFFVYGIGVFQKRLSFLFDLSENGRPSWFDASDFKILTSEIPPDWLSASFEDDWSFVVGYQELVRSEAHFNGLLERDEQDLAFFQKIKIVYQDKELGHV